MEIKDRYSDARFKTVHNASEVVASSSKVVVEWQFSENERSSSGLLCSLGMTKNPCFQHRPNQHLGNHVISKYIILLNIMLQKGKKPLVKVKYLLKLPVDEMRSLSSRPKIGGASSAILGRRLRDGVERDLNFPSAYIHTTIN